MVVESKVWTAVRSARCIGRGAVEENGCEERVLACASGRMAGLK
jgi:hypothetical protein